MIEPVAKNDKTPTPTTSQNNNQQRRGQKRKLKEDEPFVVHENGRDFYSNTLVHSLGLKILISSPRTLTCKCRLVHSHVLFL